MTPPSGFFSDLAADLKRSGLSPGEILVELSRRGLSARQAHSIVEESRRRQQGKLSRGSTQAMLLGAALVTAGALGKLGFHLADSADLPGVFTFTWAAIGFGSIHFVYGIILRRRASRRLVL